MITNRTRNQTYLRNVVANPRKQIRTNIQENNYVGQQNFIQINQKQVQRNQSKIRKISQIINRNVCMKKQINLKQNINANMNEVSKHERKKKLDVSLSKQKMKQASELSSTKSTKLKINTSRLETIRKIKHFQISNQEKQQLTRTRTPRLIQNIEKCPTFAPNCTQNRPRQIKNIINIIVPTEKENNMTAKNQCHKRKIKLHKNK